MNSIYVNGKTYEISSNYLDLSEIYLKKFSDIKGIEKLKDLKILYLGGNLLESLDGIQNLKSLEFLYLNLNHLGKIEHLGNLNNLRELYLDDNGIKEIEDLDNLTNLEILSLCYNDIKKIKNLGNLTNLKELYLSYNDISEIKGLEKLTNLELLYLNSNQISEIKGLESLHKLKYLSLANNRIKNLRNLETLNDLVSLDLADNLFEGVEDYLINNYELKPKVILEYCRNKKIEISDIKFLDEYDDNKSFKENIEVFKKVLQTKDFSDFINIGTHLESKEIAIMQNLIFYDQSPEEINLNNKDQTIDHLKVNLIQIHSLKGVNSGNRDKIGHFLFFTAQFWDEDELRNNVLVYNKENKCIDFKIEEFLKLSLLTKPNLIIFPENSIPYRMREKLKKISSENNLIIVCGLEHKKLNSGYINKVLLIDNGKCGEQIKQTPVEVKRYNRNHIRENIKCEIFPKIKIFVTSIGRIAIFVCKDFLRLSEKISGWARKNKIDYIIIPSLTSKILPFHTKLINLLNYTNYDRLKLIFSSVGEYGGSEFFSIDQINRIEKAFRNDIRDNRGEVIVIRNYTFRGDNVFYNKQNGSVHIKCERCDLEYIVYTNGKHILEGDAPSHEKDKWEFYLRCHNCGHKNYQYL